MKINVQTKSWFDLNHFAFIYMYVYLSAFLRFEGCWPALAQDANGVIFVFNPDQPNQDKELDTL